MAPSSTLRRSCAPHALAGLALLLTLGVGNAFAQANAALCGSLDNGNNGPFDYRVERDEKLKIVEQYHFTPQVEALIAGQSASLGSDLDYVLRAFPNHHRALIALMRLSQRARSPQPAGAPRPVECYFERALRFKSDDTVARMLFAEYLHGIKRDADALKQVELAIDFGKENVFTQYNAGLVLADMGAYDRALVQAHKALAMGFTRKDLKDKLVAAGKWVEPPSDAVAPSAASSSPASAPPTSAPAAAASSAAGS